MNTDLLLPMVLLSNDEMGGMRLNTYIAHCCVFLRHPRAFAPKKLSPWLLVVMDNLIFKQDRQG